MLTVNIINCGGANNLNISLVHLTDNFHNYVGTGAYSPSSLTNITSGSPIPDNDLDIGEEGRFTVTPFRSLARWLLQHTDSNRKRKEL